MAGDRDRPAYIGGIAQTYAQRSISFKLAGKESQGGSDEGNTISAKVG